MSDYVVRIADDFQVDPEFNPELTEDLFSVDVFRRLPETEPPILINGAAWSGSADIRTELRWSSDTFTGPDEPKLTADRPLQSGAATNRSVVGSSLTTGVLPRFISFSVIQPIVAMAGDFNYDGQVDQNDYLEWRRGFGEI